MLKSAGDEERHDPNSFLLGALGAPLEGVLNRTLAVHKRV
jgi:hypothetical protein